jgi:D-sedoheptulose 7-phosphate isomerase
MSRELTAGFEASFEIASSLLEEFRKDPQVLASLTSTAASVRDVFERGAKILIAGNGGSLADAMHFAEEWTGRFRKERQPFPVIVLGNDPTHMSCVGNDYGFEEIFARMVVAFAQPGDLLILLSTSGNSENLVRAAKAAKVKNIGVVGFLGKGGGALLPLCDWVVMAPGETSDRIQELHMLSLHVLIEVVERALGVA